MSDLKTHKKLYRKFKNDSKKNLYEGTVVETLFLSAFHLIEACAAKNRVHVNKHQKVRRILEENDFIFSTKTEDVWRNFQKIENQLRPKFTYTDSWEELDLVAVEEAYKIIEKICLGVLK
jgi:hypothetical protein